MTDSRHPSPEGARARRVLSLCDDAMEHPAAERAAYLDAACRGDTALRAAVNSVLLAVDAAGNFLEPDGAAAPVAAAAGDQIANYRILEPLGEGVVALECWCHEIDCRKDLEAAP